MIQDTNTTINLIRKFSGAPISLISDEDIKIMLTSITEQVREKYKVNFTPLRAIEVGNGNHRHSYMVKRRFPLKILEVKIENDIVDVDNVVLDWASGQIHIQSNISTNSNTFNIFPLNPNSVKIKYLNAWMDKDDFIIETTGATIKGDDIVVGVDTSLGFNVGDWVFIEGMDRRAEASQVKAVDTNTITLNNLAQTHESGSLITRLKKSKLLSDYVLYETAIAVGINAIGSTYTINTSYSLGSLSATKGVPYTHWQSSVDKNTKKKDELKQQISLKLFMVG